MKQNQKGFSAVVLLVTVIAIGAIGAVGWLVYSRQKDNTNLVQSPINTAQTKNFKDDRQGYSFDYPADWTLKATETVYNNENSPYGREYGTITEIYPPGSQIFEADLPGGYQAQTGASIRVWVNPASPTGTKEYDLIVDGQKAVQYDISPGPHGERQLDTVFIKGDNMYTISYVHNNKDKEKYLPQYKSLVASFKTNK